MEELVGIIIIFLMVFLFFGTVQMVTTVTDGWVLFVSNRLDVRENGRWKKGEEPGKESGGRKKNFLVKFFNSNRAEAEKVKKFERERESEKVERERKRVRKLREREKEDGQNEGGMDDLKGGRRRLKEERG